MDLARHGGVFGRHAECVPAHGMQHIEALGALVSRHHVAHGVVADMAHMDAPRRIGEHLEHVVFGSVARLVGPKKVLIRPDRLPMLLAVRRVVAFACHFLILA